MQVTIRSFIKDFKTVVGQQITQNSIQIGKGQCKDMEEYKRKVGFNEGLEAGANLADAMLRQLEEADRDDDLPEMPPAEPPRKKRARKS